MNPRYTETAVAEEQLVFEVLFAMTWEDIVDMYQCAQAVPSLHQACLTST